MATKSIAWNTGSGNISINYTGKGNGTIEITSDNNNLYEARSQQITVKTTDGSNIERTITIQQAAKVRIDISTAVVTASNQTYNGSAKTPTPTVTLNGETIPSSCYDVAYSNNTNAGTATITVTGKGEYTGTATGTFTIAKAAPTYTAPTARSLTYSGSSQYLTTAGSTSNGTIQYSADGSTWSTTRVSKTNAGSYTSYWRLVGDSNHTDISSTNISTTIAKASRTLSFADSYIVLDVSSNMTKTATPSAGSGDGAITYNISSTTYATINSSSGKVTSKTSDGSAIVTATIAEGTNYLSATASYNLYVFATVHNFAYTGSVQSCNLPPGSYQLQCWGAQGGSNAAASSYGITAKAGGKGGYSTGVLTLSSERTVYAFVGGQGGSSGNGGWNGGGGSSGSSSYSSDDTYGTSRMGCGGGATDIALTTSSMSYSSYRNNRSAASLLSRIIVAGGGTGGAMVCKQVTTSTPRSETVNWQFYDSLGYMSNMSSHSASGGNASFSVSSSSVYIGGIQLCLDLSSYTFPVTVKFNVGSAGGSANLYLAKAVNRTNWTDYSSELKTAGYSGTGSKTITLTDSTYPVLFYYCNDNKTSMSITGTQRTWNETTTNTYNNSQVGYAGGGTIGLSFNTTAGYNGTQNAAGINAEFGKGANQTTTNYRYCPGAGGGGWYGGGSNNNSDTDMTYVCHMGGGSGFVNTSASASNRPSGYTGLQLDSGTTYAGNTSFPAPGGGNETGHASNGYARITRLN